MTFSIVAFNPSTKELCVATSTCLVAVGNLVPSILPNVGAICVQAMVKPSFRKIILDLIENAPVAENMKHRAFKAIQLVWKNQLDNPALAYSLAMGLCLKPKEEMAPIDDLWVTSPRTSREFF